MKPSSLVQKVLLTRVEWCARLTTLIRQSSLCPNGDAAFTKWHWQIAFVAYCPAVPSSPFPPLSLQQTCLLLSNNNLTLFLFLYRMRLEYESLKREDLEQQNLLQILRQLKRWMIWEK